MAVHKFGPHGDAFQKFIVDHDCVGTPVPAKLEERAYTEYRCADGYDVNLYAMPKGPGEK